MKLTFKQNKKVSMFQYSNTENQYPIQVCPHSGQNSCKMVCYSSSALSVCRLFIFTQVVTTFWTTGLHRSWTGPISNSYCLLDSYSCVTKNTAEPRDMYIQWWMWPSQTLQSLGGNDNAQCTTLGKLHHWQDLLPPGSKMVFIWPISSAFLCFSAQRTKGESGHWPESVDPRQV